jgi:hypothetical protein
VRNRHTTHRRSERRTRCSMGHSIFNGTICQGASSQQARKKTNFRLSSFVVTETEMRRPWESTVKLLTMDFSTTTGCPALCALPSASAFYRLGLKRKIIPASFLRQANHHPPPPKKKRAAAPFSLAGCCRPPAVSCELSCGDSVSGNKRREKEATDIAHLEMI